MKLKLSIAMMVCVLFTAMGSAQILGNNNNNKNNLSDWRLIGSAQAASNADHDVITCQGNDDFRKIKFKVTNSAVNIDRMVVTYDNGQHDPIEVKQDIEKGGESREIDLQGSGKRSLRKIEFWYKSKGIFNGKAEVTVFGKK
jgi:hypothetical protein